jgi:hypothetical protein
MTSTDVGRFLVLNPVRTDRAEDFERFDGEVLQPAVDAQQPDMPGTRTRSISVSRSAPTTGREGRGAGRQYWWEMREVPMR